MDYRKTPSTRFSFLTKQILFLYKKDVDDGLDYKL